MTRVLVIRQNAFDLDPRVRREVGALLDAGHEVDVLCLRRRGEPLRERRGNLRILRLPWPRLRGGIASYLLEYGVFFGAAFLAATLFHPVRRYDLVQVHSLPDALVFAALVPKLFGARVLLDLHECMPEFYATRFGTDMRHPAVRLVATLEQASIRFAHATITCTEPMKQAFHSRGADPDRMSVVLNATDEALFDVSRYPPRTRDDDLFVLVSHGAIEERYGLDTAVRAVALLKAELPGLRLRIYGEGTSRPALEALVRELDVGEHVWFSDGYVPIEELLEAISSADAGLVAIRRDIFRDLTHANKMFDFIAMRKPLILSRTRSVSEYFDESAFRMFDSGDEQDLARAIRGLAADRREREALPRRAAEAAEPYRWAVQRERYLSVVDRLLAPPSGPATVA